MIVPLLMTVTSAVAVFDALLPVLYPVTLTEFVRTPVASLSIVAVNILVLTAPIGTSQRSRLLPSHVQYGTPDVEVNPAGRVSLIVKLIGTLPELLAVIVNVIVVPVMPEEGVAIF